MACGPATVPRARAPWPRPRMQPWGRHAAAQHLDPPSSDSLPFLVSPLCSAPSITTVTFVEDAGGTGHADVTLAAPPNTSEHLAGHGHVLTNDYVLQTST